MRYFGFFNQQWLKHSCHFLFVFSLFRSVDLGFVVVTCSFVQHLSAYFKSSPLILLRGLSLVIQSKLYIWVLPRRSHLDIISGKFSLNIICKFHRFLSSFYNSCNYSGVFLNWKNLLLMAPNTFYYQNIKNSFYFSIQTLPVLFLKRR